ncbi:MAG: hypothetical protein AAFZ80_08110 [Cyanobacteria bacterium P01_A01_bin.105]
MATEQDVKHYLACWLQLGKRVFLPNRQEPCRLDTVLHGDRFSEAFEHCWSIIQAAQGRNCHLEGTDVTFDQMFSGAWEIDQCARCGMTVPIPNVLYNGMLCPCSDLEGWPNDELPRPRLPQGDNPHLKRIADRLLARQTDH